MFTRIAAAAGALAALTSVSLAADLPGRVSAPAPSPIYASPVMNWTGFYFGIDVGGRSAKNGFTATQTGNPFGPVPFPATASRNLDYTGFYLSERLGYDYQFGNNIVVGIEGLIGAGTGKKAVVSTLPGFANVVGSADRIASRMRLDYAIRGRLGYLVTPATLLYATGGVAFQDISMNAQCFAGGGACVAPRFTQTKSSRTGYTIGAGVEQHLMGGLYARADYRYSDFGRKNYVQFAGTADQLNLSDKLRTHTFTIGLDYKFNLGGSSPVVSKY